MPFKDLVEESKQRRSTLTYNGHEVEWRLDGAALHKGKAEEGIDLGGILNDLQGLSEGSMELSAGFDAVVCLFWMGLQEEGVSLDDVRSVFTVADLQENRDMIQKMSESVIPDSDPVPSDDDDGSAKN